MGTSETPTSGASHYNPEQSIYLNSLEPLRSAGEILKNETVNALNQKISTLIQEKQQFYNKNVRFPIKSSVKIKNLAYSKEIESLKELKGKIENLKRGTKFEDISKITRLAEEAQMMLGSKIVPKKLLGITYFKREKDISLDSQNEATRAIDKFNKVCNNKIRDLANSRLNSVYNNTLIDESSRKKLRVIVEKAIKSLTIEKEPKIILEKLGALSNLEEPLSFEISNAKKKFLIGLEVFEPNLAKLWSLKPINQDFFKRHKDITKRFKLGELTKDESLKALAIAVSETLVLSAEDRKRIVDQNKNLNQVIKNTNSLKKSLENILDQLPINKGEPYIGIRKICIDLLKDVDDVKNQLKGDLGDNIDNLDQMIRNNELQISKLREKLRNNAENAGLNFISTETEFDFTIKSKEAEAM